MKNNNNYDFDCMHEGLSGNCNLECPFLGSEICEFDKDELTGD